ncbi:MAG: methionyl-tRNA formyltransferase [Lachnospiraceae bacterium]|nr:methionyl-tRNA formyltransferase [Lachnospiraceae bacterium]
MKIIFMGTPDFAVCSLEALIKAGHEVTCVVTQPDRQRGRGGAVSSSPVKQCALKYGINVLTPEKIRTEESVKSLKEYEADIFVVCAFGQILSEEILNMPKYGCVNIHASLLPHLRGAAPIQWSILNGDEETGVTIQQMAKGLDTGDILYEKKIKISPDETGDSLFDRLMELGASMITELLPLIEEGRINPVKQDESKATYASKITKEMGHINWNDDSEKIERYVRGLNSWPSAYTYIDNRMLKIWKASVYDVFDKNTEPGTVYDTGKDYFAVKTGNGALKILEVQLEGKKRMSTGDFLRGYSLNRETKL